MTNEEEHQKETQDWLDISDKKFDVLFDNKLIKVFHELVNESDFKKAWDVFIKLQNYLNDVIHLKTYPKEEVQAKLEKVVDLINKEYGEHGYRDKDLLKSLKRLQAKLIEEHEKLNSEKLKDCIEENMQK
jgi:hypothetical protein